MNVFGPSALWSHQTNSTAFRADSDCMLHGAGKCFECKQFSSVTSLRGTLIIKVSTEHEMVCATLQLSLRLNNLKKESSLNSTEP